LAHVQFWPWPPAQGQTLVAWLRLSQPVSLTASFGGAARPVFVTGRQAWLTAPIPPLATPGPRTLVLTAGGQAITMTVPVVAGTFPSDHIPASTTDAVLSDVEKVRAEAVRVAAVFGAVSPGPWSPRLRFRPPLAGEHEHTSPFGSRRLYGNSPVPSVHNGEDYGALPGTPVFAPAAATVALAEPLFVRGNAVILDHGQGVYTGYWHLQAIDVRPGDQVTVGQKLGEVGSTGLSTGAHLHWEMQVGAVPVDPLQWLAPAAAD
jgi:murein DD-endopeptidase MepM/ murein hydrolase activator NlpD